MRQRGSLSPRALAGALVIASLITACGGPPQRSIMRRINGQSVVGPAVSPHAYGLYIQAERAYGRGEFQRALHGFVETQSHSAQDPYLISRIAAAQAGLNRMDEASDTLEAALVRHPSSEALWSERARLYEMLGQSDNALSAARMAITHAPLSSSAALLLDSLMGNDHAEALAALTAFLQRTEEPNLIVWRRIFTRSIAARDRHWAQRSAVTLSRDFPGATHSTGLRPGAALQPSERAWLCGTFNDGQDSPPPSAHCP